MSARIALFQSTTGIDPAANADALVEAIGEAAAGGAEMLFTPEMSGLLDRDSERARANLAGENDDSVLAACRKAARDHRIWVHLGSLAVLSESGKVANRAFVIDSEAKFEHAMTRSICSTSIFRPASWRRSATYAAGGDVVVVRGTSLEGSA